MTNAELKTLAEEAKTFDVDAFHETFYTLCRADLVAENAEWGQAYNRMVAERDALKADAERYRWLRMRLKVKKQMAVSGSFREALDIRIGCAFLDSKLPRTLPESYPEELAANLDSAIDEAMKRGEA